MKIKSILLKLPFWIFCISMILFFYIGLAYPEQTNYWLATNGIIIMILEFISIFSMILLLVIANKNAEIQLGIEVKGILADRLPNRTNYFIGLICVMIMALVFTSFYNIWLFVYFLISSIVKFVAFKQIKTTSQTNEKIRSIGITIISLIFSAIIGFILSIFLCGIFQEQLALLYEYHSSVSAASASIQVFVFWGILYFAFLIFFDWYADFYEARTGKPFVGTYR